MADKPPTAPKPPTAASPRPAKPPEDPAEQRAAERRAREAQAEVDRQIALAQAKKDEAELAARLAQEKILLLPEVTKRRSALALLALKARHGADSLKAQVKTIEAAAGDLEGSIITAAETARIDPKRALLVLTNAENRFKDATK